MELTEMTKEELIELLAERKATIAGLLNEHKRLNDLVLWLQIERKRLKVAYYAELVETDINETPALLREQVM